MTTRNLSLGLLSLALVLTSCSHCRWNSAACGAAGCQDMTTGRSSYCSYPRWYWSNGKYHPLLDNCFTYTSAENCAVRTFNQYTGNTGPHRNHFRDGYIQAFIDVAFGSNGVIPAVPPQKYWKANNRSPLGYDRAHAWFEGYRAGVCDAQATGRQEYLYVPTSVDRNVFMNERAQFSDWEAGRTH